MTFPALSRDKLHTEEAVEAHFAGQLVALQGWRERPHTAFDRKTALDPEMIEEFVRTTQPDAWKKLGEQYPGKTRETLARQVEARLKAVGTLEVLRKGITIVPGIKIALCAFKPSSGLNAKLVKAYEGNVLTVMRQVRYSMRSENALDTVLFVNGIPIVTMEFKNTLTGSTYQTAETQYRRDRAPNGEPLLSFKRGALVHFALDQDNVSMTTHLNNGQTRFLPFNRGREGGAGNPDVEGEFRIAYLYRDLPPRKAVFSREVLLGILQRFVLVDEVEQPDGRVKRMTIWPRYHQLDAVSALVADARLQGAGQNYLFQHSAGSGKSNTIAWAAHHLATLHDEEDRPVFDTVIIVTDRVVLDRQLQATVKSFSQTAGYVRAIDGTSRQLREAIQDGAKIIISTIHKFSTDQLSIIRNEEGKRFAIIIDEAHSSQSGKHADSMARVLAEGGLTEEEQEIDETERALLEMQRLRGPKANLSYLAFTATPKNVTMERFGRPGPDGPAPFHLYAMRQAIEEGFILDVLRNYQTYKSYARLERAIEEDPRLLERKSARKVARFIDFHETAMDQKAAVIVEHFRRHVLPELNGQAKAMVVTSSREHAIRTHRAIARYIEQHGYGDMRALVAFSGEVTVDGQDYTEVGINGIGEKELPRHFDGDVYNVLVVAEKYQTGFDQPKLVAMYIDRKLSGVQAVQTLARLNRTFPGKERTFILDFRNEISDIQEAFKPYYNVTHLEDVSDPNQVYNLHARLMAFGILQEDEIDRFVERFLHARQRADERPVLEGIVRQAVERFNDLLGEDDQEEFRQTLNSFLRFYSFICQVVNLQDTELEKLHVYGSWLKRILPTRQAPQGEDVTDDMLALAAFRLERQGEARDASLPADADAALGPIDRFGANPYTEEEQATLSEIIEAFNQRHGTNFTEDDYVRFEAVNTAIVDDETWAEMLRNNPPNDVRPRFDAEFMRRAIQAFQRDNAMRNAFMQDQEARDMLMTLMFQRAVRAAGEAA
ncbi:type I restriction endonuclease subunit R [Rhodovulum adriaticum]|uniref:Type I restriction enzyme R subunit n=1 Tax=Rhodovulum adriaticum TaxID=35804 RepID=A0A4R2NNK3_RHOAD|nr:DEAD/DEAH box helicase family protein [Rhodovulum adriaticum]MBK1634363.1 DEAD/DEAH box helicase [Rhodovulum adriaticum]TCP23270.1 type I restriction enzyme R subunit [Rhodovulum adriaticum]